MKLKRIKAKIRPMRGPVRVNVANHMGPNDALEFIGGMGYFLYEDPTDEEMVIITNKTMTYDDFGKSYLVKGSKGWFDVTYAGDMNKELAEYRW